MAIARDATSGAALGTSPNAGNHTCSGSDRILIVGTKGSTTYASGVTYNGVAMTRITDVTSGVGEYNLSLWYLIAPASGTNSISATVSSGTVGWTAVSYTDISQTGNPDATNSGTAASGTSHTVSVTTLTDNSWVVGYFSSAAATLAASTGITFVVAQANNVALGDSNGPKTPAGSYSMTVTSGSGTFAGIVAALKPVGGGGGGTSYQYLTLLGVG